MNKLINKVIYSELSAFSFKQDFIISLPIKSKAYIGIIRYKIKSKTFIDIF